MGGKKVFFGIISLLISFNFLYTPVNSNFTLALDIKKSKEEQRQLKQKDIELRKKLSKTTSDISEKEAEIKDLRKKIEDVTAQLRAANAKINKLSRNIETKQKEISKLEADIKAKMERLMLRVRVIYKSGDISLLDIFMGSSSFSDILDKLDLVSRLSKYDAKLINNLNRSISLLDKDKSQLEENKSKLLLEKKKFATSQSSLKELVRQHEKALSFLNEEKLKEQSMIDENNAAYKELQRKIDAYYEEQARKNANSKLSKDVVVPSGKRYAWPVPGFARLSSLFMEKRGRVYHKGIDIAKNIGGPSIQGANVVSADDGKVMFSYNGCVHNYSKIKSCGCGGGYGNYIFIDHGAGRCTVYGHLSTINVKAGQKVKKGQKIGTVGSTGHSTGPHLHFECRRHGVAYDPMSEYRNSSNKHSKK